ncbi:MAG: zinc-binding dehydrogenase [Streptosporangiales bacterium]|nr:zinc-binding dehydrogenase [Streptosporangiales bacterium]
MMPYEVHLAARPKGEPRESDFAFVEVPVPEPGEGQAVVRNLAMSVDPYMRGRMNAVRSYAPPYELGQVMYGGAVGVVERSTAAGLPEGATVLHNAGWREYALLGEGEGRVVEVSAVPATAYLGALGMPGLTAYVGLLDIAAMREGDVVFVSGAAGAVGTMAGQLARLKGASRVIGSAGSAEKVAWLTGELGFDAALNYKDGPVAEQLAEAAPDGIDVYFDNVGGEHLQAAIGAMNEGGRAAECGMISQYNNTEPKPGPNNLGLIVGRRLTLRGFIVSDHNDRAPDFYREVVPWVADGSIVFRETFSDGIHSAPKALMGLFRGANVGKMVVRL